MKRHLPAVRHFLLLAFGIMGMALLVAGPGGLSVGDDLAASEGSKTVLPKAGLNMRAAPDQKSKKVCLIPHGESVEVLETKGAEVTVAGKTGHWVRVKWKRHTGWVFDAFLGTGGGGRLLERFNEIAIRINKNIHIEVYVYKKAGDDRMSGDGGAGGEEQRVTGDPVRVEGNAVVFWFQKIVCPDYVETEMGRKSEAEARPCTKTFYKCRIDGKKILSAREGKELVADAECAVDRSKKE